MSLLRGYLMRLEHFIVTRFCCRGIVGNRSTANRKITDPLNPKYLELRFKLFEITCLPSILAQTDQNFGWILIIDKDLRADFRDRISNLVEDKKRVYLYEYDPLENLQSLDWIEPFLVGTPDYVMTTNQDNDDAIPKNFISAIHSHLFEVKKIGKLPPLKIIASKQIVQWDLITSLKAPLGWKCSWHKRRTHASYCGFSFLCKYPEYKYNVLGRSHIHPENYFDWSEPPIDNRVKRDRKAFRIAAERNNENLHYWSAEDMFYDISRDVGPVLMTNHSLNVQKLRLYAQKSNCERVVGPETFPNIIISWDRAHKYAKYFKKNVKSLIEILRPAPLKSCNKGFLYDYLKSIDNKASMFMWFLKS